MSKKYIISLVIIFILIVLLVFVGKDYTNYLNNKKDSSENASIINKGNLSINYDTGNNFELKGKELEKKFSITNMSDSTVYYIIKLTNINYQLLDNKLTMSLESNNDGANINDIEFPSMDKDITEVISIPPLTTQSYKLYLNALNDLSDSEEISGNIDISLGEGNKQIFSDIILANNNLNNPKTTPGKKVSDGNEGLISSKDDDGTTYYFRGEVNNNYVKFANLNWRIVRINGDKSVRLILDSLIDKTYPYNSNTLPAGKDDYYSLAEYRDASISNTLKDWYNNNLSDYNISISDSKFCSDVMLSKEEIDMSYYGSYVRINNNEGPSFNCSGTIYSSNIGLLSVDEIVFAGAYKNVANTNYYLYNKNINKNWLLSSPYAINKEHQVSIFDVNYADGNLNNVSITEERGIRPVISLKNDVSVSGTGTSEDPYIVQ